MVNWCPVSLTALSDEEVIPKQQNGKFYTMRYEVVEEPGRYLEISTTRPETLMGDTAVAVNPLDERHQDLIGKHVWRPFPRLAIPIIADEHADPELGSGAVKITPAHDFNDWQVYERNKAIGWINILDAEARICAADGVPADYVGLAREDARKKVVADLEALELIERIEQKTIQMPYGDRSGVVIEPWLTDQWYVNAAELAKDALSAVHDGRTQFVPKTWEKTYFNWMENIQPWCVSRQLWWGHRIPAWYTPDGSVFVAETEAEAQAQAGDAVLTRDEDVLDTWFSSALWPFGTLGWPEQTTDLARHYPGDELVTPQNRMFAHGKPLSEEEEKGLTAFDFTEFQYPYKRVKGNFTHLGKIKDP
jgi:valyl-tRNA synthetase